MVNRKNVAQINLKDIVKANIKFCLNNDIFDKDEYSNVVEGEMLAYTQILDDIEIMAEDEFILKYVNELKKLNVKFEDTLNVEDKKVEKLSGYNNAIINILKLVNPIYEYRF